MSKRQDKKRFSALIHPATYDKVDEFVKENELITSKLAPGSILEIGLNMFFKEVEKRPLEEIAVEYLTDYLTGNTTGAANND